MRKRNPNLLNQFLSLKKIWTHFGIKDSTVASFLQVSNSELSKCLSGERQDCEKHIDGIVQCILIHLNKPATENHFESMLNALAEDFNSQLAFITELLNPQFESVEEKERSLNRYKEIAFKSR